MITHRVIKNVATVTVAQDKPTFDTRREFRRQVNAAINNVGVSVVAIDMEAVEYIDSAALGYVFDCERHCRCQKCASSYNKLCGEC